MAGTELQSWSEAALGLPQSLLCEVFRATDGVQDRAEMSRASSWASMAAWGSFTASAKNLAQLDKGISVMGSLELDFKEVRLGIGMQGQRFIAVVLAQAR